MSEDKKIENEKYHETEHNETEYRESGNPVTENSEAENCDTESRRQNSGKQSGKAENYTTEDREAENREMEKHERVNPKAGKEDKKNRSVKKKKTALWHGVFSQICAMIMVMTVLSLFLNSIVCNASGQVFFNGPLWQQTDITENYGSYGQMLHYDVAELVRYLAVASQLETDGDFDENKEIDVVQFAFRKRSEEMPENLADLHLVYKLGDLLEWSVEGFDYTWEEVQADTLAAEDAQGDEDDTAFDDIQETVYEVEDEAAYAEDTDEADNEANKRVQENFKMADGSSLYDVKLPEGVTYYQLAGYIQESADSLYINYDDRYMQDKKKFTAARNLKYMVLDKDENILYSNLDTENISVAELKKAFRKSASFIIYEYENNNIDCQGVGGYSEISTKRLFHEYSYLFADETIYVAVQDGESAAFGAYNTNDGYAKIRLYNDEQADLNYANLIASIIFGILAIIFLVFFTIRQPRKRPEELAGIDRWFTEIAAVIAVGLETLLFAGMIWFVDDFYYIPTMAENGYLNAQACMAAISADACMMYLLFLVFYGSLVRRIKARALWKGSFVCRCWIKIKSLLWKVIHFFTKVIRDILNDRSFIVRVVIPCVGFVLLNIFTVLIFRGGGLILDVFFLFLMVLYLKQENHGRERVIDGIERICNGDLEYQIPTERLFGDNKVLAQNVNQIGNVIEKAVKTSMNDERLKADLITNVSHDIKTPLTSIINYVDLLKRENISGEKAQEYIRILDEKSQRLKQLTLDLVEASKISSGNIEIEKTKIDVEQLLQQAVGEYEGKLADMELSPVVSRAGEKSSMSISADSRHMWRILDNLFGNICKYALRGTRVYIETVCTDTNQIQITMKNISAKPLNMPVDELLQRFVRGDEARSTEGSGLGLSIAQNLTLAQGGRFNIYLDGDLFKTVLIFPAIDDDLKTE